MNFCIVSLLLLAGFIASAMCIAQAAPQKVTLPHFDASNGAQPDIWTGYINVNATYGRNIFYWIIEATEVDPRTAPLVVWFQVNNIGDFYCHHSLCPFPPSSNILIFLGWTRWIWRGL
jgi:hypothetical protein